MFWMLTMIAANASEPKDLLRFVNDDQLRGTFLGMKDGPLVVWQHPDLSEPADFKTPRLRQIVLRGGRPSKPLGTLSHLGLVNGDRIPGVVTAMTADSVTLDTGYAGELKIPRNQMAMLAPNPLGGQVHYHGPFNEEEWKMVHPAYPEGLPSAPAPSLPEAKDAADAPSRWNFTGASWSWDHERGGTALVRESSMPELAQLRFDIAWKNRLNLAVAFHSDFFHSPAVEHAEGANKPQVRDAMESASLPLLFGNSYVLHLFNNYLTLMKTKVDAEGKISFDRDHRNNTVVRLGDAGRATVEIRSNRRSGEIALFINGEFAAQWNGIETNADEPEEKNEVAMKGSGFGFIIQGVDSPVRISDIIVCEWNGMPDSARSLQSADQDVVLMCNGTDRYAGSVKEMDQTGKIMFEGKHGQFRFPLKDVAEIRFARNPQAAASEAPENQMLVRLGPLGLISGQPLAAPSGTMSMLHPIVGELNVSTEHISMIEFNAEHIPNTDWNADF